MSQEKQIFKLKHQSSNSKARVGELITDHGKVPTPIFMPVGTAGSVKTMTSRDLEEIQAEIVLGNTYHLFLRPGLELILRAGGLHKFINWKKPMLTDSGGFQVWSLSSRRTISDEGVEFRSHIDGHKIFFSPEIVMEAQRKIGADIIMAFDECPPYPSTEKQINDSLDLTLNWTKRAVNWLDQNPEIHPYRQFFFPIIQGGLYPELRRKSIEELMFHNSPGYAIGGLSVGEPKDQIYSITNFCTDLIPMNKPRYVMGMGTPQDLLQLISLGIDMFDCVIPTRNARNGMVWTWEGALHFKAARYAQDLEQPLDSNCRCYTCQNYSRAYLRHLFKAEELTVLHLATLHNLFFFMSLMEKAREKIQADEFETWSEGMITKWSENEIT